MTSRSNSDDVQLVERDTTGDDTNQSNSSDVYSENGRSCWVCFATDDDESTMGWVQPCNCKGTTKWVHQYCLQRWVDEKQKGDFSCKVFCPQCNAEYIIVTPSRGILVYILDTVDTLFYKTCPLITAGLFVGALYWSAVTYGAVTVMQVLGREEGMKLMSKTTTVTLVIGLPSIPLLLVCARTVRWDDGILSILRQCTPSLPFLRYIVPSYVYEEAEQEQNGNPNPTPSLSDTIYATKVLCGALMLPTIATIVGNAVFESVPSRLHRTLIGGFAYIAVSGVLRVYHRQQKHVRKFHRKIMDRNVKAEPAVKKASNVLAAQAEEGHRYFGDLFRRNFRTLYTGPENSGSNNRETAL